MPNPQIEGECAQATGLLLKGDNIGAISAFQEILTKDERIDLAWHNRGLALMNLGHPFDAILNIDKAIALQPKESSYHNSRGAAFYDSEKPLKALESYENALKLRSNFPEALYNKGNALKFLGQLNDAIISYRKSVKAKPDYADAHLALSIAYLMGGQYEEGWKEFEWRWKTGQLPERGLPIPIWDGSPLEGKALLIYGEQGHGDTLQFIRYAPMVKERFGGKILVEVRQPLARLARSMQGIDGVMVYGEKVPSVDFMIAMMSLPRIFGTTVDTIPYRGPYFKVDQYRANLFREKLKVMPPGPLVGVCWAGMSRPGQPAADAIDLRRSTTLQSFAPLAAIQGISWVSLQKGPPSEQVRNPPRGMRIVDFTEELDDFYDTAALIENLDLVITVDTAVVHLAAALGKPTWLLSRYDGCWRWLGSRSDSPWYYSLRQFTQPKPGAWAEMMEEVAIALRQYIKEQSKKVA